MIRTIIVVTMLMVAMIGTAAAVGTDVYEMDGVTSVTSMDLVPGGSAVEKKLIVEFLNDGPMGHNITHSVGVASHGVGTASPDDIIIRYQELDPINGSGLAPQTYPWTQESDDDSGEFETLRITFAAAASAPNGATYEIQISDDGTGNIHTISCHVKSANIPEFPTIALPVAAILGLAFIFQRRREED